MANNVKQAKKKFKQRNRQEINNVLLGRDKKKGKEGIGLEVPKNKDGEYIFAITGRKPRTLQEKEKIALYYIDQYENKVDKCHRTHQRLDIASEKINGKETCLILGRVVAFKSDYRDFIVDGKKISKLAIHAICLGSPFIRKSRNETFQELDDNHLWLFDTNYVPLNEIYTEEYLENCRDDDCFVYMMNHYRQTNKNKCIYFGDEIFIACELETYQKPDGTYKRGVKNWSPILSRLQYYDTNSGIVQDVPRSDLYDDKLKHLRAFEFDREGKLISNTANIAKKTFERAREMFKE